MTTWTSDTHTQAVLCNIEPMLNRLDIALIDVQSRPTIKRTGENGDTVFLAPAATPASSLTAGNAKKCGLMYSTLYW